MARGKIWTEREYEILKKCIHKKKEKEIAEILNRSLKAIQLKVFESGLSDKKSPLWSKNEIEFLQANYCKLRHKEIAKELGRTTISIRAKLSKIGLTNYGRGIPLDDTARKNISLSKQKEKHPNWKGDNTSKENGRTRANRWFKQKPCILCKNKKGERHHIDGNPLNNNLNNIKFLCRRCHMIEDGRLKKLSNLNKKIK